MSLCALAHVPDGRSGTDGAWIAAHCRDLNAACRFAARDGRRQRRLGACCPKGRPYSSANPEVKMIRSLGAMARAIAALIAVLMALGAAVVLTKTPALAAVTCDRNAAPSSFASEVSAATAGQTICLA